MRAPRWQLRREDPPRADGREVGRRTGSQGLLRGVVLSALPRRGGHVARGRARSAPGRQGRVSHRALRPPQQGRGQASRRAHRQGTVPGGEGHLARHSGGREAFRERPAAARMLRVLGLRRQGGQRGLRRGERRTPALLRPPQRDAAGAEGAGTEQGSPLHGLEGTGGRGQVPASLGLAQAPGQGGRAARDSGELRTRRAPEGRLRPSSHRSPPQQALLRRRNHGVPAGQGAPGGLRRSAQERRESRRRPRRAREARRE